MDRIIECVPNYSEGRDRKVIDQIVAAIAGASAGGERAKVLGVEPGAATNRTVVTFVGSPEAVCEAAFQGSRKAQELIDMRKHHGTHPRSGAIDVLPLVPVSGVSLEECATMARTLSRRMYEELGIPCYCYEASAYKPERKNLAVCRQGEYEALPDKIADPGRRPDYGPDRYNEAVAKSGASNVGARDFLIAVNFNLDTTSAGDAREVAMDVREKGRPMKKDGEILRDGDGHAIWQRGKLKGCKALGWYIEEYGIAQVSMNITDINAAPLHMAYEEVRRSAEERGIRVTGTEIIGLLPKRCLLDAGAFFLHKKGEAVDASESELVRVAVESMGLDDLCPFESDKKVIEYMMEA